MPKNKGPPNFYQGTPAPFRETKNSPPPKGMGFPHFSRGPLGFLPRPKLPFPPEFPLEKKLFPLKGGF